ncbi:MAG: hypothetical protein B6U68_03540 [Candidatus Aenigmarchaeota archaeon ex4484_14]|nr:MAG: hypothetical protein B6U68_03540 [Candidatus Aenigmarchaeota archaeon ex4484_14]
MATSTPSIMVPKFEAKAAATDKAFKFPSTPRTMATSTPSIMVPKFEAKAAATDKAFKFPIVAALIMFHIGIAIKAKTTS